MKTKRGTEAPGQVMQGAPRSHIRGSNSDDCEQDGKAGGPGAEGEEMKTYMGCQDGIPYDPI